MMKCMRHLKVNTSCLFKLDSTKLIKSEFYWKLHKLAIKAKEYMSSNKSSNLYSKGKNILSPFIDC